MPKKPNKSGQPQEYVPAGNGDSSGEYADDGGSNRHFTSFKKPEEAIDETKKEQAIEETSSNVAEKEEEPKKTLTEQAYDEAQKIMDNADDREKIEWARENAKNMIGSWLGKREQKRLLEEFENRTGDFTDEKMLEYWDKYQNAIKETIKNKTYADLLKNQEKIYYKLNGHYYCTKDIDQIPKGAKLFNSYEEMDAERTQAYNIKKERKEKGAELTKKEQEFISRTGYKGNIGLQGITEKNKEEIFNATERIFNDFPELKDKLASIGTERGLQARARNRLFEYKKTEQYKQELENHIEKVMSPDALEKYGIQIYSRGAAERNFDDILLSKFGYKYKQYGMDRALAWCSPLGSGNSAVVFKNSNYEMQEERKQQFEAEKGFRHNVSMSFEGTTYHELGHAVSNMIFSRGGYGSDTYGWDVHTKLKQLTEGHSVEQEISFYATTNDAELIAECFDSHYSGENNPLAESIYNYVIGVYNKQKGR